jgi:protein-S-isoprenylcysteine O-methyltransferase Ste14
MRTSTEKHRILVSRFAALIVGAVIVLSRSYWEVADEAVAFTLFLLGIILVGIASLGRMWCSLYIAGFKNKRLIAEGPYSLCRNPLYLFSLAGFVGLGFTTETFTFPIVFFLLFAAYYPFVIKAEELRLARLFGSEFEEYRKKVPRFFPRARPFSEPEVYTVNPRTYRRHMFSALWFIWIVGIFEVFEGLGDMSIVPTKWVFY